MNWSLYGDVAALVLFFVGAWYWRNKPPSDARTLDRLEKYRRGERVRLKVWLEVEDDPHGQICEETLRTKWFHIDVVPGRLEPLEMIGWPSQRFGSIHQMFAGSNLGPDSSKAGMAILDNIIPRPSGGVRIVRLHGRWGDLEILKDCFGDESHPKPEEA